MEDDYDYLDCPPQPEPAGDLILWDGMAFRDFVEQIVDHPDGWRIEGQDRISTLIAVILAFAHRLDWRAPYTAAVNYVRLQEHCLEQGLAIPPPGSGVQEHRALDRAGVQHVRVWNNADGPYRAEHHVICPDGSRTYRWTRPEVCFVA